MIKINIYIGLVDIFSSAEDLFCFDFLFKSISFIAFHYKHIKIYVSRFFLFENNTLNELKICNNVHILNLAQRIITVRYSITFINYMYTVTVKLIKNLK